MESPSLFSAAKSYVMAAMDLLNKRCPPSPPQVLHGLRRWEREGEAFRQRDMVQPYWVRCVMTHANAHHSLNEHGEFVAALRRDPEIGPQLEALVGHEFAMTKLETHKVTDRLVWQIARRSNSLEFSEEAFAEEYRRFDSDLRRKQYEIIIAAPLLGLVIDAAPTDLEKGLELDRLSDDEIANCLEANLFASPPVIHGLAPIRELFGVRIHYVLPKRDIGLTASDVQPAFDRLDEAVGLADQVLHALRTFGPGRVSLPGSVRFNDQWPVGGWRSWQSGSSPRVTQDYFSREYKLTVSQAREFATFWRELQSAKKEAFIATAVRRFGYASDRDRRDDRLVDLMIAAESLFLRETDAGEARNRGEMRYRLAERFAFFVGEEPGCPRRSLFRQIRNAYDVRSAIVHGAAPSEDSLKVIDEKVSIEKFVHVTEQLLRLALKKMVHLQRRNALPDWTKLIFG